MKTKGLTRSLVRKGVRSSQAPVVARHGEFRDPTICNRCGAVWTRRTWRKARTVTAALLARAAWGECPACAQVASGEYFGCVRARGAWLRTHEDAVRRRVTNVAARAAHTQPERRAVSVEVTPGGLDVLTTSQKLAHRIAHELVKAFGGRAAYRWSDADGSLLAIWNAPAVSAPARPKRREPKQPAARARRR